jgi:hypothetical protein
MSNAASPRQALGDTVGSPRRRATTAPTIVDLEPPSISAIPGPDRRAGSHDGRALSRGGIGHRRGLARGHRPSSPPRIRATKPPDRIAGRAAGERERVGVEARLLRGGEPLALVARRRLHFTRSARIWLGFRSGYFFATARNVARYVPPRSARRPWRWYASALVEPGKRGNLRRATPGRKAPWTFLPRRGDARVPRGWRALLAHDELVLATAPLTLIFRAKGLYTLQALVVLSASKLPRGDLANRRGRNGAR